MLNGARIMHEGFTMPTNAKNGEGSGDAATTGSSKPAPERPDFNTIIALQRPVNIKTGDAIAALRRIVPDLPLAIEAYGREDQDLNLLSVNGIQMAVLNLDRPCPPARSTAPTVQI